MGTETKRMSWLDLAKGLGLIFVMLGHGNIERPMEIVYFFHMPLFFFLSGYVYSGDKYDAKTFMINKVKRLLVPYYVLGLIMYACNVVINLAWVDFKLEWLGGLDYLKDLALDFILQKRFGTLWYISTLFWLTLLLYGLLKLCRGKKYIVLFISFVMVLIGAFYYHLGYGDLYFNIDIMFTMFFFYCLGYCAKKSGIFEKAFYTRFTWLYFLAFAAICLAVGFLNLNKSGVMVNIFYNEYGIMPLMYISSIAGTIAIISFSKKVKLPPVEYIGRYSMIYYGLHQCLVYAYAQYYCNVHFIHIDGTLKQQVCYTLACMVISLVVLTIPTALLRRWKFGWIFGV